MYDLSELQWAHDALWQGMATRLQGAPERLTPGAAWTDPGLLLGQTCGYPLVTTLAGRVRLVATPCYRAAGCDGALYRSAIIVRADDPADSLADLRGRRCAVNGWDSNSGMNVLRAAIAPLAGGAPRFFESVEVTGAHAASVAAVAAGAADVAAIDCVTWALLGRVRPNAIAGLRVLAWSAASPGLPLITSLHTDAAMHTALLQALMHVAEDPALAAAREALLLAGFATVQLPAYDAIAALERGAAAAGYPVLR